MGIFSFWFDFTIKMFDLRDCFMILFKENNKYLIHDSTGFYGYF